MTNSRSNTSIIGCLSILVVLLICTNIVLLGVGYRYTTTRTTPVNSPHNVTAVAPAPVTPRGNLSESEQTTIEIFRHAAPSVVYVTNLAVRVDKLRMDITAIPQGTGSGFVWDSQGHIVTNYHVIHGAQALRVTFADQTSVDAQVVGVEPDKDLAVLRITGNTQLQPLPIGSSHDLQVGQNVFAIGNPFGLDHTLSTGVISGLDREITSIAGRPIMGMVQTDAAINPGNSGGPLLDSAGRLIGINTAIYSPSGTSAGVGFAVPVDTIRRIIPELITHGHAVRPGLGIQLDEGRLATRLSIRGVLILGVLPNSPAAQAHLEPARRDPSSGSIVIGDVIVGADGEEVTEPNDLYRIIDRHEVGDRIKIRLMRGRSAREVEIELMSLTGN